MTADLLRVLAEHRLPEVGPDSVLTVAGAQLGGPWLDIDARMDRLIEAAELAAAHGCELLVLPETYLSGYPFWLPRTDGARFNDPQQKACYAYYLAAAIAIDGPEVVRLRQLAGDLNLTLMVGVTERGQRSGRGSTYCSLLTLDPQRGLVGHHRKLIPTYDERLVWANGDGAGLVTHQVGGARVGGLNCWENWMPQARQALYADGEDLHVSVWPGSTTLTADIPRFAAMEGRVFSLAVSGVLRRDDIPDDFPLAAELRASSSAIPFNGGSALAGPDGSWLIPPIADEEGLIVADIDLRLVAQERLTFDPTGHYSRPDVFHSTVFRGRRDAVTFIAEGEPPTDSTPTAISQPPAG
ncbi:MAG: carbon-nitrogen hydrolase family protein [Mycobacterium sp.]